MIMNKSKLSFYYAHISIWILKCYKYNLKYHDQKNKRKNVFGNKCNGSMVQSMDS